MWTTDGINKYLKDKTIYVIEKIREYLCDLSSEKDFLKPQKPAP